MNDTLVKKYAAAGTAAGCRPDQMLNFVTASVVLQPRQLVASAAARSCDQKDGPMEVGYGGARGGGKSYWLLAQMGADDCQRVGGLKCLLLRKVGKANLEHFDDLRRQVFASLPHEFSMTRGVLKFANGSRIVAGHFQTESDVDAYLGLEYDVIGVEEATTLTRKKYEHIRTCCRSPKRNVPWRPRMYSTTNAGGVGHPWYRSRFVEPFLTGNETETRFIPARVTDNSFCNPEYRQVLERLTGWERRAWLDGDWDIAAGQYFTTFRRQVHVVCDPPSARPDAATVHPLQGERANLPRPREWERAGVRVVGMKTIPAVRASLSATISNSQLPVLRSLGEGGSTLNSQLSGSTLNYFDDTRGREWFAAMDYGYAHYTVVLLGCKDGDGNVFVVDEHAEQMWLPEAHARAIKAMVGRHCVPVESSELRVESGVKTRPLKVSDVRRFVAGSDVFSRQSDGTSVAKQYGRFGIRLHAAHMERVAGWAEVLNLLGDPDRGVPPKLFIHQRCQRLINTLPDLQHDPNRPEDVLKVDADEQGAGGDDAADALRYMVTSLPRRAGFEAA